mmetsp:Transcript_36497/g.84649  ORF Transcript_36497/g.84649 Transcript_36497/m.84649 type:complete len:245 (+) Transcript_36497:71-805(+)
MIQIIDQQLICDIIHRQPESPYSNILEMRMVYNNCYMDACCGCTLATLAVDSTRPLAAVCGGACTSGRTATGLAAARAEETSAKFAANSAQRTRSRPMWSQIRSTATKLRRLNGTTISAARLHGSMNCSCEGLTKRSYCSITMASERPRCSMSRWIRRRSRRSESVSTYMLRSYMSRRRGSCSARMPSKMTMSGHPTGVSWLDGRRECVQKSYWGTRTSGTPCASARSSSTCSSKSMADGWSKL